MSTDPARPVSSTLERLLVEDLNRHQIVVWLDRYDQYSPFVDALAARTEPAFGAPIVAHRGSYLQTMQALEAHTEGPVKPALLLHVPHATEPSLKHSPLHEVRVNGIPFQKNIKTLVTLAAAGHVPADEVEAFLAGDPPTLADADAWLSTKVAAASGELSALLRELAPSQLHHDLLRSGAIAQRLHDTGDYGPVWHYLAAHLGLPEDWPFRTRLGSKPSPRDIADALASWAMCVEYVHDLRRPTVAPVLVGLDRLATPLVEACREVAAHARTNAALDYGSLALDLQRLLEAEKTAGTAADLGRIDTFRFEEEQLFSAAVDALTEARFDEAHAWARDRLQGKSFWLDRDPARKSAWLLVRDAARLGVAVAECTLDYREASALGEASELYAEHGAPVDRLHRELEQSRQARLYRQVPHYERLCAALEATRTAYVHWADRMARAFSDLCEREGALPSADYQQRRIFEDVVRPLLDDDTKTALFMVDGLRFEMAQQLVEQLGTLAGTAIHLRPRLAELPSVTEVGMNVLAPVADGGTLRPVLDKKRRRIKSFQAGTFRVHTSDTRKKAIARRAGGTTCPQRDLISLLDMTRDELVQWSRQARLVVVHYDEIDASGEKGVGPSVFAGTIRKLHKAWKRLRDANIQRFVITSDHGFMLRSPDDPTLEHGQGYDALARYALYPNAGARPEQLAVSLRSLDYADVDEHLLLPRGLEVYRTYQARTYVHGGNSPQERVIPVLTVVHKRAPGSDGHHYRIRLEHTRFTSHMHTLQARVESVGQRGLAFVEAEHVDLDLRVVGDDVIERHLVEARGSARLDGDIARVRVGASFELLFRLTGPREARVPIELFHPSGTHRVDPHRSDVRFDVEIVASRGVATPQPPDPEPTPPPASASTPTTTTATGSSPPTTPSADDWLDVYDDPGVRKVFAHLDRYGSINEAEATAMLGSPRKFRSFSRKFEDLVQRAPFVARIDHAGGSKRYVKESDRHE